MDLEPIDEWAEGPINTRLRPFYAEHESGATHQLVMARSEEEAYYIASGELGPDIKIYEMDDPLYPIDREVEGESMDEDFLATWREEANAWLGFYALAELRNEYPEKTGKMEQINTVNNLRNGFFAKYPDMYSAITGGSRQMGTQAETNAGEVATSQQTLKRRSLEAAVAGYVRDHFEEAFHEI